MSFEMNCCWIALVLAIVNLISLAVFFNYSIRINGRDKAFLFTGNKKTLPINLKAQTNYHQSKEESYKRELESKVAELEKVITNLQGQINNNADPVINSFTSRNQQTKNTIPTPPPSPPISPNKNEQGKSRNEFNEQLKEELKKRRKKIEGNNE